MIDSNAFARLPEKKRQEAISAILLNAFSWYYDAKRIIESGSYGHGVALLIVAREEVAKAVALSVGFSHRLNLKDHGLKHGVLESQTFGRNPLMDQFQLIMRSVGRLGESASPERLRSAISEANREYLSILLNDPSKKEEYARMKQRYAVKQYFDKAGIRLREGGLYVEVKNDGGYESPAEVDEQTARNLMDVALEDIYWTDQLYNGGGLSNNYGLDTPYRIA
jgi:hypothetical protein